MAARLAAELWCAALAVSEQSLSTLRRVHLPFETSPLLAVISLLR
jgi:hypothetical protein